MVLEGPLAHGAHATHVRLGVAGVSDPRWPHASPFMTFVQTMLRA